MADETLAEVLCRADDSMHHHEATDDFPCWHCKQHADAVTAHLAAILADPETVEAVADSLDEWLFRMHGLTSSCDHQDEARAAIAVIAARQGVEL